MAEVADVLSLTRPHEFAVGAMEVINGVIKLGPGSTCYNSHAHTAPYPFARSWTKRPAEERQQEVRFRPIAWVALVCAHRVVYA